LAPFFLYLEDSISRASEGTVFSFFSSVEFTSYRNALTTKSIVITGASKGIGRAAADALVEQGSSAIGVARRPLDPSRSL
jgi:shikimate 5-dehydrogenase